MHENNKEGADIGSEKQKEGEVMIRIAIVDDEKVIREQIKKLIEKKQTESVIDTYCSGEEFLRAGRGYDIVFLDIQMDGINGIDTAKALRQKAEDTVLIFVTGVKEYVFDAFDVGAFHYLIKPLEEIKFSSVYDRALLEVGKKKQHGMGQIFVKTRNRNVTLDQSDILYIESRAKKVDTTAWSCSCEPNIETSSLSDIKPLILISPPFGIDTLKEKFWNKLSPMSPPYSKRRA